MDTLRTTDLSFGTIDLVEYGDFGCSRCRQIRDVLSNVLHAFDGQVTYTYRHFPARHSELSMLTAMAAEAARRQGCFWPMYNAIFKQPVISLSTLSIMALSVGMDYEQFQRDMQDNQLRHCVEQDCSEGHRLGVITTPTFFVNGQQFHGKLTYARLAPLIRTHLNRLNSSILSKVDLIAGTVRWGQSDWL